MTENTKVIDPDAESAEFCLDCVRKHTGKGLINIKEVIERFRQNPNYDDPDNLDFIWIHADKAMNEFAEAEEHVNKVNKNVVDENTLQKLGELGHKARTIRDQIRTYVKTIPNKNADNYAAHIEKIKSKAIIPRIDLLWKAKNESEKLRPYLHKLTAEIGCGDCLATPDDLVSVDKAIEEIYRKETLPLKNDHYISDSFAASTPAKDESQQVQKVSNMTNDKANSTDESALFKQLKELKLPTPENLLEDAKQNFKTEVIEMQVKRVKTEIESVPFQLVDDVITAVFGSSVKRKK